MSRDGNGNYSRVPGSAYTNGTTADGPELEAEMNDIASALTASLAKDGQTVPTANLPMGGFKHTNVDSASARTQYARADQVQDGTLTYLTSVSGTNTITASAPIGFSSLVAGQEFRFIAAGANTGAVTLNISGSGAKNVVDRDGNALVTGAIRADEIVVVRYDGTEFQISTVESFSGQLAFPATQNPSSDPNTLDDYEEGTFTPTVVSSGGGTPTYAFQIGRYTKVGNRCHFDINVQLASTGTLAAGNVTVAGLPFTVKNVTNYKPAFSILTTGISSGIAAVFADAVENTTAARVFYLASGSATQFAVSDLTASTIFRISGSFEV